MLPGVATEYETAPLELLHDRCVVPQTEKPARPNAAGPANAGTAATTMMMPTTATAGLRSGIRLSPLAANLYGDRLPLRDQLPQHERENAAMLVIVDLDWRIDAHRHRYFINLASRVTDHQRRLLPRTQHARDAGNVERLAAGESERLRICPLLEL